MSFAPGDDRAGLADEALAALGDDEARDPVPAGAEAEGRAGRAVRDDRPQLLLRAHEDPRAGVGSSRARRSPGRSRHARAERSGGSLLRRRPSRRSPRSRRRRPGRPRPRAPRRAPGERLCCVLAHVQCARPRLALGFRPRGERAVCPDASSGGRRSGARPRPPLDRIHGAPGPAGRARGARRRPTSAPTAGRRARRSSRSTTAQRITSGSRRSWQREDCRESSSSPSVRSGTRPASRRRTSEGWSSWGTSSARTRSTTTRWTH